MLRSQRLAWLGARVILRVGKRSRIVRAERRPAVGPLARERACKLAEMEPVVCDPGAQKIEAREPKTGRALARGREALGRRLGEQGEALAPMAVEGCQCL